MELFNANKLAKQSFFIDLFCNLVKIRVEKFRITGTNPKASFGVRTLRFAGLFNLPIPMRFAFGIGVSQINLGEAQDQRLQLFEPQASFVIA
jgi:hypothetical protein